MVLATAALMLPWSVTSRRSAWTFARRAMRDGSRAVATTVSPRSANRWAMAAPKPELHPVTRTTATLLADLDLRVFAGELRRGALQAFLTGKYAEVDRKSTRLN